MAYVNMLWIYKYVNEILPDANFVFLTKVDLEGVLPVQ